MAQKPVHVLITGATEAIGLVLHPMIAGGLMFGPHKPVVLCIYDKHSEAEALKGRKMELEDAGFPLLHGVIATTDAVEASIGVGIVIMIDEIPRKEGMERRDAVSKFRPIYGPIASALEKNAAANCKVVVVAKQPKIIAFILNKDAPSLLEKNITFLSRFDHNRALGQISERLEVPVSNLKNVVIWGIHPNCQYPDFNYVTVETPFGEQHVNERIGDALSTVEFANAIRQREAAIFKALKRRSALSVAKSLCDHVRDWLLGTPEGTWVSMAVISDGSYNVQPGIIYSFPVICQN